MYIYIIYIYTTIITATYLVGGSVNKSYSALMAAYRDQVAAG